MTANILPIEQLVDAQTGLIRRVEEVLRPSGAPAAYTSLTAEVADARQLGEWPADRVSLGTTFNDPAGARIAAIAEGIERYCGNFLPECLDEDELVVDTAHGMQSRGLTVVPLEKLPKWTTWQREREGFQYCEFTADTETLWARGVQFALGDQSEQTDVWMPASLIYLNWRQSGFRDLARIHHLNYAGIATGQGARDAQDRGLLEVIERDALELWWHLGGRTRGINPGSVPGLVESMAGCDLEYWIVEMPSEFAPAMAALIRDPATGVYAAGFSANVDPAKAATKAVLEAVHTWIYTSGCIEADGWVFQAVKAGLMAQGLYLEHRTDRRYLDSAGSTYENVIDLGAHVQVWLDDRTHELATRFTRPADGVVDISQIEATTVTEVYRRIEEAGFQVVSRDLTTSDVRQTSLRVVRTVVPGLIPNAPAAFAYLGMERFRDVAISRGWRDNPPEEPEDFTLTPPPHM